LCPESWEPVGLLPFWRIGRSPVVWAPRSPDLNRLDFVVLRFLKAQDCAVEIRDQHFSHRTAAPCPTAYPDMLNKIHINMVK
jgi:hypothetical protein